MIDGKLSNLQEQIQQIQFEQEQKKQAKITSKKQREVGLEYIDDLDIDEIAEPFDWIQDD